MKKIEELTLAEYDKYKELKDAEDFNIFELFEFLGIKNAEDLDIKQFTTLSSLVLNDGLVAKSIKEVYDVGGRKFKAVLTISDIKAAQFIDYQTYSINFKLDRILSVFLLPEKSKGKFYKYNTGYDMAELQKFIYNNFTIGDAYSLSAFFLTLCIKLLPIIKNSLARETAIQMHKTQKRQKKK